MDLWCHCGIGSLGWSWGRNSGLASRNGDGRSCAHLGSPAPPLQPGRIAQERPTVHSSPSQLCLPLRRHVALSRSLRGCSLLHRCGLSSRALCPCLPSLSEPGSSSDTLQDAFLPHLCPQHCPVLCVDHLSDGCPHHCRSFTPRLTRVGVWTRCGIWWQRSVKGVGLKGVFARAGPPRTVSSYFTS